MAYPVTQLYVPGINDSLSNSQYNSEFQNVYANVGKPQNVDDYSTNLTQFQSQVDPGEIGSESQATSLSEELERLRFAIKDVKNFVDNSITYWYETPTTFSPSNLQSLDVTTTSDIDVATISANVDPYTGTILTLETYEEDSGSFFFIKCISDTNGSPLTQFSVDQGGNVICGNITTTGLLTIDASSGIQADKLILAEDGTGSNTITIQGPDNASTTTHALTIPGVLPAGVSFFTLDATGQVSYSSKDTIGTLIGSTGCDNIAATISATGANAIAATMTATGADAIALKITTVAAVGANVDGAKTFASGVLSSTVITRTGRPVMLFIKPGNVGTVQGSMTASGSASFAFQKDATTQLDGRYHFVSSSAIAGICYVDYSVGTGSVTYGLRVQTGTVTFNNCKLVAIEI